jgi:2-oxoglutarate dehydrogenase E2 component (dihydrolipoamide succinyltransferase)
MGLAQIKMPQLGESVTEGTVEKWLKSEGDFVKRDEPIVEVVTDKVNAEIPSPFEGKLIKISVTEGETVLVGAVIAQIEVAGAAGAAPAAAPAARPRARQRRPPRFRLLLLQLHLRSPAPPGPVAATPAAPPPSARMAAAIASRRPFSSPPSTARRDRAQGHGHGRGPVTTSSPQ